MQSKNWNPIKVVRQSIKFEMYQLTRLELEADFEVLNELLR